RAALAAMRMIILSSKDRLGDSAPNCEMRIDACLQKPVQQEELLETILRVPGQAGREPQTVLAKPDHELTSVPKPAAPPRNILLAEDDEFSSQFMEQLLARRG